MDYLSQFKSILLFFKNTLLLIKDCILPLPCGSEQVTSLFETQLTYLKIQGFEIG